MLVAMEGSSPTISGSNNYKYYVWQAFQETIQPSKTYIEGPAAISMTGSPVNIRKMANAATEFIKRVQGKRFLVGWSRGAAACIQVAHDMKNYSSPQIDAMFLFDAVDMDTSTSSNLNLIPSNVVNVYHAIATKKNFIDRMIFPTCGKQAANGVNLVKKEFNATHNGIAGTDGEGGDAGSRLWMWNHMKSEGVL